MPHAVRRLLQAQIRAAIVSTHSLAVGRASGAGARHRHSSSTSSCGASSGTLQLAMAAQIAPKQEDSDRFVAPCPYDQLAAMQHAGLPWLWPQAATL